MAVASIARSRLNLRPAIESRPPAQTWLPRLTDGASASQPMLDFDGEPQVQASTGGAWMAAPPAELPDPKAWSVSLARVLIETLQDLRPIGQLNRWVDEKVLAAITIQRRQRTAGHSRSRPTRPATLHSVHLQFPTPLAVEVAAHFRLGRRSIALAFRLEEFYGRWLSAPLLSSALRLSRSRTAVAHLELLAGSARAGCIPPDPRVRVLRVVASGRCLDRTVFVWRRVGQGSRTGAAEALGAHPRTCDRRLFPLGELEPG